MEGDDPKKQTPITSQIIEIKDTPAEGSNHGGTKVCAKATCTLSDTSTTSADAQDRRKSMQKLFIAVVLCIIFMSVEVIGGIKANSLAILTDAAHLLSDVAAFAISLFSLWATSWEATPRQSYGFFRIEILGALVSIQLIWLLTGILVYEAIFRLIYQSGEVKGSLMFAVSAFGLVVNIIMAVMLGHGGSDHGHGNEHVEHNHGHEITITTRHNHRNVEEPLLEHSDKLCNDSNDPRGKKRNINVQGAYLHVLGDSVQSIGVMIGGAVIWYKPEWKIIDLICTLLFSVIVLATTINMLRNVLEVLMESTPREIDATMLEKGLCELDGVVAVHELHIWAITVGKVLLACHVTITPEADADLVLDKVVGFINRKFNISHVTIQIERQ